MRIRATGTLQPIRTSVRRNYDPQKGITTTTEYETVGDNCNGLAAQCVSQRIQFDHQCNPRRSKLVASATGPQNGIPELPVDTWQLLCNEIQKDVREHPSVMALRDSEPDDYADLLQAVP